MGFKARNIYTFDLRLFVVLVILLMTGSCNNDKSNSSDNIQGMDMKEGDKPKHDTMKNMEGMDMGEHDMESMNKTDNTSSSILDSLKIGSLVLPTNYRVISSQKSIRPTQNKEMNKIKGQGYISVDERRNYKITVRFSGRIEKLYIKYNFEHIKKGEKIMDIYSPELNTYQEELLFLLKGKSDSVLIGGAEEKLRLLGVSQAQINNIKKTGKTFLNTTVYSPKDGYVFFRSSTTGSMSDNSNNKMGGMRNVNSASKKNILIGNQQIREGSYVNKGDIIFWLNDLDEVWAMVVVDNNHEQILKAGENVSLISELYKNDTLHASVNFIEPVYQQSQKFIMSRIYLKNINKKYKVNSLVEAIISTNKSSSIMVPYSSVLFLGKRKIVWVLKERTADNNKIYEARDVVIGLMNNGMVEIKKGLNINEEIALDAGYLLDRESLIKPE